MNAMTRVIVGMDEVGRGAWAGPLVVGAAAVLDVDHDAFKERLCVACNLTKLTDSKKHTHGQREKIMKYLASVPEVVWGIGEVEAAEIDHFGLTRATMLAAERALASLKKRGYMPAEILADAGLHHPFEASVPTQHFVKGDETILPITIASIAAKEHRDGLMRELAHAYPGYGFEKNVGYGTAAHRAGIMQNGIIDQHRRLFLRKLKLSTG